MDPTAPIFTVLDRAAGGTTISEDYINAMPPHLRLEMIRRHNELHMMVLDQFGPSAFEMPKRSTAGHEAGHAVYEAGCGLKVGPVEIYPIRANGLTLWCGRMTSNAPRFGSDHTTRPESDLAAARLCLAGICGELVVDGENYRTGSSIDELVMAKTLISNALPKMGLAPEEFPALAEAQRNIILEVLGKHAHQHGRLVLELMRRREVRGALLRRCLAGIDGDPSLLPDPWRN